MCARFCVGMNVVCERESGLEGESSELSEKPAEKKEQTLRR